jgi:copper chaperone
MILQLKVPNMACSACEASIIKAVNTVNLTATVQRDTKTKIIQIET